MDLGDTWTRSRDTSRTFKKWLRQGVIRAPAKTAFAEYLDIYALIRSPEIRVAEVDRHVEFRGMSPNERRKMVQKEHQSSAKDFEVLMFATTYYREHNDFAHADTIWQVDLIVNNELVIPADTIKRDRRPKPTIRSEYPWTGDFAEVYTATFKSPSPWNPKNKKIQLRVSSTIGNVKLTWLSDR